MFFFLNALWRGTGLFVWFVLAIIWMTVSIPLPLKWKHPSYCASMKIAHRLLGVKIVSVKGKLPAGGGFVVSNHISFTDIPMLMSCFPLRFLSKAGVSEWPVVGFLATRAGTLYIARGERGASDKATEDLKTALAAGWWVHVFPEGTTTDGKQVRKFHPRLFKAAVESGAPVYALAIRYTDKHGKPSETIPFINDDNIFDVLKRVWSTGTVYAYIEVSEMFDKTDSRDEIAKQTGQWVSSKVEAT